MSWLLDYPDLLVFAILFVVGFLAGRWNERRHYASIRSRERDLAGVLVFSTRFPPDDIGPLDGRLVSGSAVISDDYFKNVVSSLYSFFGGRVRSYESLIDRARRESVLRMKHDARALGASMIINVKFQTLAIGGRSQNSVRGVELLAYGTALAPSGPRTETPEPLRA
jgi:uncharacterized protein YbjQ (UPF0145 family)